MFNSCIIHTMSSYRPWATVLSSALWLVLTAVIWIAFAPVQAGGQAAYVIVNGNSMEPDYHLGDLIIVRPSPYYAIGDSVVYESLELERNVFHRIIDMELDRYILKGDNNSWIDAYQPTQEEVIGKLWAHLPQFGKVIQFIRRPIIMAIIVGLFGGLQAMGIITRKRKGRRNMKNKSLSELLSKVKKQSFRDWISNLTESGFLKSLREKLSRKSIGKPEKGQDSKDNNREDFTEGLFFVLGLLVFGSLILGVFAFTRPATRVVPDNITYQHFGFFSYSATAPDSVYDSGTVQSGEPIFPKTTCVVDINFQYTLVGDQTDGLAGSHQMSATVTEPQSGWQRSIPLESESPFTGNTYGTRVSLDVCQVITLIEAMENETEFHPGSYTLLVAPEVSITGSISGRELNDTFEPNLIFRYTQTHFQMMGDDLETDALSPIEAGILRDERMEPNVLPIFGLEPKVPMLRFISILVFVLSSSGMVILGIRIQTLERDDRVKFVSMKYASLLVEIKSGSLKKSSQLIDVTSIDSLAKLAERYNVMILHEVQGHMHFYYVQGDGVTYRNTEEETVPKEHKL